MIYYIFTKDTNQIKRSIRSPSTLTNLKYFCINHGNQRVFLFKIIINVLVGSFRFIWIPMLWVYDHNKYLNYFRAGTVFIRQILTSVDVRFWRIKTSLLKGLNIILIFWFMNTFFLHLKLEFASAIPASNEWIIVTSYRTTVYRTKIKIKEHDDLDKTILTLHGKPKH